MLYMIMLACHYHSDIKKITFRNCILKCQQTRAHGPLHAHLRNIVNICASYEQQFTMYKMLTNIIPGIFCHTVGHCNNSSHFM